MKMFKNTSVGIAIVTNDTIRITLQTQKITTEKFNLSGVCELNYQPRNVWDYLDVSSQYASRYIYNQKQYNQRNFSKHILG
jgi:hypothetical protein